MASLANIKIGLDDEARELLRMLKAGELATKSLVEAVAREREQLRSALVAVLDSSAPIIGSVATTDHLNARAAAVRVLKDTWGGGIESLGGSTPKTGDQPNAHAVRFSPDGGSHRNPPAEEKDGP